MDELKRCPLCGRKMKVDYKLKPLRYGIAHVSNFYWDDRCYGGTDYDYFSEAEAIKAWNRRADEQRKADTEI